MSRLNKNWDQFIESRSVGAEPALSPSPVDNSRIASDRRHTAGTAYESNWGATQNLIDNMVTSGERDLTRILSRLSDSPADNNATQLGEIGYRVAGRTARASVNDGNLESRLFISQKNWLIQRSLPLGVTDIVELGSGIADNLFALWLTGVSSDIRFHALEYTAAGRACAERLATLVPRMKFRSVYFDYYESTMEDLRDATKLFVFSCYSIEQITYMPDRFFERLLALPNLHSVLHIEPVGWQYPLPADADSTAIEVDRRMRKSAFRKGYNQTLVPQLHALARADRIVIDEERLHFLAHRPDLPGTAILYRPRR
jgi:hypothetical protein